MPNRTLRIAAVVAAFAGLSCEKKIVGQKLADGIVQRLTVENGAAVFLLGGAHPEDPSVPQDLYLGELWLGPLDHPARKVGAGVSSQPGSFALSADGKRVAYLARFRFREGAGELWYAKVDEGQGVAVAREVREFGWSKLGALAYVAPNTVGLVNGYELTLPGVQTITWSPDGRFLAARASSASGGKLWLIDAVHAGARVMADATSDFAFASDGTLAALGPPGPRGGDRPLFVFDSAAGADGKEIAQATAFQFSPDGKEIALLSTARQPGEATGDLYRLSRAGGKPVLVASKVSDWRWSSTGELLCLARYDLRARAGTLTVSPAAPKGDSRSLAAAARELAGKVQAFTAFGHRVLYLVQAPQKGDFKLELWGTDLAGGAPPRKVDEGVYGWDLTGDTLLYKARCAGGPRSCSLLRVPFGSEQKAELVAADVAGFDLSRDGSRLLVQQPHQGASRAVDLLVLPVGNVQTSRLKATIEDADPSARFADDAGKKVVYATLADGKQGVYVADVP
jgi:dipeptidyl aminopeptidase/acylaminoacyl peptidase